jgi:hypothetical protein
VLEAIEARANFSGKMGRKAQERRKQDHQYMVEMVDISF